MSNPSPAIRSISDKMHNSHTMQFPLRSAQPAVAHDYLESHQRRAYRGAQLPGVNELLQPSAPAVLNSIPRTSGRSSPPRPYELPPQLSPFQNRASPHKPGSTEAPSFYPYQDRSVNQGYIKAADRYDSVWPVTPVAASPQTPGSHYDPFSPRNGPRADPTIGRHHHHHNQPYDERSRYPEDSSHTGDESGGDSAMEANLPKFVREELVPDEGLYYVYDDGSRCPAIIDGEPVNQRWGITKAGKPRKRLAVACLTCREKKIKCEPGEPKCVQCEKSGKECRVRPARGHQATMFIAYQGHERPPGSDYPSPSDRHRLATKGGPLSPKPLKRRSTPLSERFPPPVAHPADYYKKRRKSSVSLSLSYHDSASTADSNEQSNDSDTTEATQPTTKSVSSSTRSVPSRSALLSRWKQDPYEKDPGLVKELMKLYFVNINSASLCFFPQGPLIDWIVNAKNKSKESLMLMYAMLAVASQFHSNQEIGVEFASVCKFAEEQLHGQFTLQLVQTRLLLVVYHYSNGDREQAGDYCGSATRAATSLGLNVESSGTEMPSEPGLFGLNKFAYMECRRRTFWSAYGMDRLYGHLNGLVNDINDDYITVKLPMEDQAYQTQILNQCPSFPDLSKSSGGSAPDQLQHVGPLAHMVLMSSIWGDVSRNLFQIVHKPSSSFERMFERFQSEIFERLTVWTSNLPPNLQYTPGDYGNLDTALKSGYGVKYIAMHALHFTTVMTLRRYGRVATLRQAYRHSLLREAVRYAKNWLEFVRVLGSRPQVSIPFVGFATTTACDVISAKGRISKIPDLCKTLEATLPAVDELGQYWASAQGQADSLRRRVHELKTVAAGTSAPGLCELESDKFAMRTPIDRTFAIEIDMLYMTKIDDYFNAIEGISGVDV